MRIAITGKSGLLSTELQKIFPEIIVLDSYDYDITDPYLTRKIMIKDPDIIIHAGAVTDSTFVKTNPTLAINTNIVGTANISNYCIQQQKRLVYISTDYIYEGTTGNYNETDPILPYNEYAWTKLGGECSVRLVLNHLIIRTSFGSTTFPYEEAWTNQLVSKDYVDVIAPMILEASKSNIVGVLNIGTESKSLYEYAQKRNNVKPIQKEISKNFTLNTEKYEQSFLY
jgi:dTDP-4-dehydrorhamnose reductase